VIRIMVVAEVILITNKEATMSLSALITFGFCLMCLTPVLAVTVGFIFARWRPDTFLGKVLYNIIAPKALNYGIIIRKPAPVVEEELLASEDLEQKLEARPADGLFDAQTNSTVQVRRENVSVIGRAALLELQFFDPSNKDNKVHVQPSGDPLKRFEGALLQDGRFLVELPRGEKQSTALFELTPVTSGETYGFGEYLKGDGDQPGPAAKFAKSNQKGRVEFNDFPGVPGSWRARDLAWFRIRTKGKVFAKGNVNVDEMDDAAIKRHLPRYVFFVSRDTSPATDESANWLITAELRGGNGDSMVFTGKIIDPNDITDVFPIRTSETNSL
jgi:hypothetical protein